MNQVTMLCILIDALVCLISAHGVYGLRRLLGELWPTYKGGLTAVVTVASGAAIYGSNTMISILGS